MLDNKFFVDIYILSLDKNFEIFIPVNEKIGNIINLISKNILGTLSIKNLLLLNLYSGQLYNYNDLVRNTDIKNGTKLILI